MCCCRGPRQASPAMPPPRDNDTRQRFRKMLRERELDDREIEIEVRALPVGVEIMAPPGMEEMTQQLQGMFQNLGGGRSRQRKVKIKEALKLLVDEEAAKMINEEELKAARGGECRTERHRVHRRDRQDRAAPGNDGSRRVPRGRAARSVAVGRRLYGEHQVRHRQDRSCAVHRLGRIPHVQALRSDPRAAGPPADPGGTGAFGGRGLRAHLDGARCLAVPPVLRACWPPRASTWSSKPRACSAWRKWRSRSTSAPKISARAACTPSWNGCWSPSPSTPPTAAAQRVRRRSRLCRGQSRRAVARPGLIALHSVSACPTSPTCRSPSKSSCAPNRAFSR